MRTHAWLGVAAGSILLAAWLAPALPNGDGLGYLNAAALGGAPYPAHLAMVPLLRAAAWCAGRAGGMPGEYLAPARVLCALAGLLALWGVARLARWAGARPALAVAGAGVSAAALAAFGDVESYAPALAAATWTVVLALERREAASMACAVAAVLIHAENAVLVIVLWGLWRRRLVYGACAALCLGAIYGWVVWQRGLGWLAGASHGFGYQHGWLKTPAAVVYGIGKTLVWAPYPYEAGWGRVIGWSACGVAAAGALGWLAWRGPATPRRGLGWRWLLPYALVGVVFFPSEAERSIFALPLAWALASRARPAALVAAAVLLANLLSTLPRDLDGARRARAAASALRDGDLVVSPGHGWDEHVTFIAGRGRPFPLAYHAGAAGSAEAVRARLADAARGAARLVWIRLDDASDALGWKELAPFGITPANARDLLPPGDDLALGAGLHQRALSGR